MYMLIRGWVARGCFDSASSMCPAVRDETMIDSAPVSSNSSRTAAELSRIDSNTHYSIVSLVAILESRGSLTGIFSVSRAIK